VIAADVPIAREQLATATILVNLANELAIAQALRSLFHGEAKRESLIQCGKGGACRFTDCGFLTALYVLLDGFQAIRRYPPAGLQFPSA
jgi:hypothetical protein